MKTRYILFLCLFSGQLLPAQTVDLLPVFEAGERLIEAEKPDSALVMAQNILSKRSLDPSQRAQASFIAGRSYFILGEPDSAIHFLNIARATSQKWHLDPLLLQSYLALSAAYGDNGYDFGLALEQLEPAKALAEKLKDTISLANYYIYHANIYHLMEEYERSMEYSYFAENLIKNTRFEFEKAKLYAIKAHNLLEFYINTEDSQLLKDCQEYYKNAIPIYQKLNRRRAEAIVRNALAGAYLYSGDLREAGMEVQESIHIGKIYKDTATLINGYYNLATLFEMEGKADSAISALSQLRFFLGEKGSAWEFAFMKREFGNSDERISNALINSKIDIFNKQLENQKIAHDKEMMQYVLWLAVAMALFMAVLVAFFLQKQRLTQTKLENTLKSQEIEFMRARFEGEELGRHRIARQIHDGVGGLLVSAKWSLESALDELSDKSPNVANKLRENLKLQENSYKELRRVVYALEREDRLWWDDLQQLYQQLAGNSKTAVKFYTYNLDRNVGGTLGEEARMMVQETITNALKHSKATEISVQINQIDKLLSIIVEDNGIGFDPKTTTKGVGLRSLEERCSRLGGSITFESRKGAGATVFIDIPIKKRNPLTDNPLLYAGTN
ncbi:MAG: hypothetical protein J0M29_20195 [Chitinophagales bacterium]|nr:hypothetical protein [Chitinophagales bacterium]